MNKDIKIILILIAIIYLIIGVMAAFHTYATSLDKETIFQHNGQEFKTGSFKYDGRIYVPLRTISSQFGYEIKWNSSDKSIKISNNNSFIQFQLNSNIINLNNTSTIKMDVKPSIVDGITFLPIRYAVEPLGKFIQYYEDKTIRVINITDTKLIQDVKR